MLDHFLSALHLGEVQALSKLKKYFLNILDAFFEKFKHSPLFVPIKYPHEYLVIFHLADNLDYRLRRFLSLQHNNYNLKI